MTFQLLWISAQLNLEVVNMKQIVKFFDDERKRSCMEWLFDDTVLQAPTKAANKSAGGDGALDFMLDS